jgi:hypothetical protein
VELDQRTLDRACPEGDDLDMRLVISLSFFLLAGCAASSPTDARDAPAGTLQQLQALIGSAACTDSSQCRTVAIGARACGGPQGYLAWSTAQTDGGALRALAERYKAERQAEIKQKGEMSDCRFLADPGASCRSGTCHPGSALIVR